jgi:hypothetical protein
MDTDILFSILQQSDTKTLNYLSQCNKMTQKITSDIHFWTLYYHNHHYMMIKQYQLACDWIKSLFIIKKLYNKLKYNKFYIKHISIYTRYITNNDKTNTYIGFFMKKVMHRYYIEIIKQESIYRVTYGTDKSLTETLSLTISLTLEEMRYLLYNIYYDGYNITSYM